MKNFKLRLTIIWSLVGLLSISLFMVPTTADDSFEELAVSAQITLQEDSGKIILTNSDIYRLEVVDQKICLASILSPRQISLIGQRKGTTEITFWLKDDIAHPTKVAINVTPKPKKKKRRR